MNKKLFVARALSFIPEQLGVFFYRCLANYALPFFKKNKISIWPRNSLVLNRIEPFLSDIDVSIFFDANIGDLEKEKILRHYRRMRRLIPIFGEPNVYSVEDRELILRNINRYELLRDPSLCQKLQISDEQKEDLAEKIAFLFRMFHSDWRSLRDHPKFREKKWMGHFLDLGLRPPQEVNFQVIQKNILDLVPLDDRERVRLQGQLNYFYELLAAGNRDWTIPDLMKERDLIWAFYPQFFCYQSGGFVRENSFLMQVCRSQIKWEIFGCLTQHLVFDRKINLQKHIARLIYYCEQIGLDSGIREDLDLVLKKTRDKLVFEQDDEDSEG